MALRPEAMTSLALQKKVTGGKERLVLGSSRQVGHNEREQH